MRRMNKISIAVLLPLLFFVSCRSLHTAREKKLQPVSYVQWIEDTNNGLRIDKEDKPYRYELQYQPPAYLALRQLGNQRITSEVLKEEIANRGDYLYFSLKMQTERDGSVLTGIDMPDKSSYLLSGIQKDMFLLSGSDSLACIMSHVEPANSLIPYDQCLLAFEKPKDDKEDLVFLFRTDVYRKGWLTIPVKRENINKIPQLKIK